MKSSSNLEQIEERQVIDKVDQLEIDEICEAIEEQEMEQDGTTRAPINLNVKIVNQE